MTDIRNQSVRLGFVQLTDSAPLLMAQHLGIYQKYGLNVELMPQPSWSTLRDRLKAGVLDFAQMLAPMPLANRLGLSGSPEELIAPMILSQNGNAITLSNDLVAQIKACNGIDTLPFPLNANMLKAVIEYRKAHNLPQLCFASVFHHSCHRYQLLEWINNARISFDEIQFRVVPPLMMADSLKQGHVDGFCVGGPYNASLVRAGEGQTVLSSYDIWPDKLEKVMGTTESFYQASPEIVHAMCAAILDACEWLYHIPNRFEAARTLARPEMLNQALDEIAPSLLGSCLHSQDAPPQIVPNYNRFSSPQRETDSQSTSKGARYNVNRPTLAQGTWLLGKMQQYDQLTHIQESEVKKCAEKAFREDIFEHIVSAQQTMHLHTQSAGSW